MGTLSFQPAGTRSVSEGTRTMMETAVRTAISVILPVMLFHMIRWCSFPYPYPCQAGFCASGAAASWLEPETALRVTFTRTLSAISRVMVVSVRPFTSP